MNLNYRFIIMNNKKIFYNSIIAAVLISFCIYSQDCEGGYTYIENLPEEYFNNINNEILFFKQKMFYYKLNLHYDGYCWYGTKAVKKKNFISPQWLRNLKSKKYPFWRFDTFFSKKKYMNIKFVDNGGWHFTCIKKPEEMNGKSLVI